MSFTVVTSGDLFRANVDVLVNATNASGIMGAGIAKQFRLRFPVYYHSYMASAAHHELILGLIHAHLCAVPPPFAIVSLHTMEEPGQPGDLGAIKQGLFNLGKFMDERDFRSVAIPALGCGIGGLDLEKQVLPAIKQVHSAYDHQEWIAYGPR